MRFTKFLKIASFSLSAVSETFAPSPDATARDVRINGAICILVGFLCLAGGIFLSLEIGSPRLALGALIAPALFMYASLIVGGYRLVFGANSNQSTDEILSLKRVLFGTLWVVIIIGVPIFTLIMVNS
jgi:hypothetical protein